MSKIARTYRLEEEVIKRIEVLQKFYSDKLGVSVSQADTIKILVRTEWESLDKNKLNSFIGGKH